MKEESAAAVPSTKKRGKKRGTANADDASTALPALPKNDWRSQEYAVVPIDSISPRGDDEDANRGDKDAIGESVDANGFFGAIYVRKADRKIIAGKTRWGQLRDRGDSECPVILLDVEPERADAINIADNRTRDHAKTKDNVLADMVARIQVRCPDLKGLGIRPPDVTALLAKALPRVRYLDHLIGEDKAAAADEAEADEDDPDEDEENDATDFEDEDGDPRDEGPEEAEANEGDIPEFERREQPRHPLPIVLSNAQMRQWASYKKRVGERKDLAAFLVLLAAAMNEDDPAA